MKSLERAVKMAGRKMNSKYLKVNLNININVTFVEIIESS
jgi:hypothetical protein